jgi:ubiquinone/menaquinone biosynthesis C-methylase UbiE
VSGRQGDLPLDNPMLVRWEFASEERLATRNAIYRKLIEGQNAEEVLFKAVVEAAPERVLEVGCGAGELAERLSHEAGCEVVAVDISERMVALTRARGIEAGLGDMQALPFEDELFDCVVAGWVLYHVADRNRAISECARVLRPGGTFLAATLADEHLADVWEHVGLSSERTLTFSTANGAPQLARHFEHVEAREAEGVVVFPDANAMRQYIAADMTRAHAAANVPEFAEPFRARSHHTVFLARKKA